MSAYRLESHPVVTHAVPRGPESFPVVPGAPRLLMVQEDILQCKLLRAALHGVESHAELRIPQAHGCPAAWGYLFARPMPQAVFMASIAQRDAMLVPTYTF